MRHSLAILAVALAAILVHSPAQALDRQKSISLFDGKTLEGWEGDPRFWSIKDGALTGQTTAANPTEHNTFLIWRGGKPGDFQLDMDFRLVGGNSGIQYRSKEIDKWVIGGYQADFDAPGNYSGILYEERGRGILALTGEKVVIGEDGKKKVVGHVGDADKIKAVVKKEQWNHYTVIAQGNHLIHKINGVVTVDVTDNQADKRSMTGLIALQVHQGHPMTVQFKNVQLTPLGTTAKAESGEAVKLFNGKDLSGWSVRPEDVAAPADLWTVTDGVLACKGKPRGYLRTNRDDFANYVLTLQWRWPGDKGGNNGVLVHTSSPHALGVWPKSIEVQLASQNAGDFWVIGTELDVPNEADRVKGRRHLNLTDNSEKPIGQWNDMEITCKGDEVIVKVNGDLVNHATHCNVTQGAICLQSEGTPIEFRNIVLKPLQ